MKNLILSAAMIFTLVFNAAASVEPVNEKAEKTLHSHFKEATSITWNTSGKNHEAYFINEGIKTRVTIDSKGNLIQTIRYYSKNELPLNVLEGVKKEYRNQEVYGVTEVSNKNGINYRIVMRDAKNYTLINANNNGDTEFVKTFKRIDR